MEIDSWIEDELTLFALDRLAQQAKKATKVELYGLLHAKRELIQKLQLEVNELEDKIADLDDIDDINHETIVEDIDDQDDDEHLCVVVTQDDLDLTQVDSKVIEEFECPVCLEVMTPPKKILTCSGNGHLFCGHCYQTGRLKTCPKCREDFGQVRPSRSRLAERWACKLFM